MKVPQEYLPSNVDNRTKYSKKNNCISPSLIFRFFYMATLSTLPGISIISNTPLVFQITTIPGFKRYVMTSLNVVKKLIIDTNLQIQTDAFDLLHNTSDVPTKIYRNNTKRSDEAHASRNVKLKRHSTTRIDIEDKSGVDKRNSPNIDNTHTHYTIAAS